MKHERPISFGLPVLQRAGAVRFDPFRAYNFMVEIDGLICGGFSKVEGLSARINTETYVEGGRNEAPHHYLVSVEWDRLVLTTGMGLVDTLWRWFEATVRGALQPRNGVIMLLGAEGIPRVLWEFREALPVAWKGPSLEAETSQVVAIESLELQHRGLTQPIPRVAGAALGGITGSR